MTSELRRTIYSIRNRINVAASAVITQLATTQEVGGRAYDRQKVIEIVGNAPSELANCIHFLRLPKRIFGLSSLGDIDCFGQDAGNYAVLIENRTHREIKKTLASCQIKPHFRSDAFAFRGCAKSIEDDFAHPIRSGKPWSIPEGLSGDVFCPGANARKCRRVGV